MITQSLYRVENGTNDRKLPVRLHIRPIRPSDAAGLQAGFQALSETSRYYRFHSGVRRLSESLLRYLTEVDAVDHVALVAFERLHPGKGLRGVAVGRFVRNREASSTAEVAVTVIDEAQGRGIARQLLAELSDAARARGIDTFTMNVLSGNRPARRLLKRLGAVAQGSVSDVMTFHLPVTAVANAA